MCRLADGGAPVYYVAPEFVQWMDYQRYARNGAVIENSVFIDCTDSPQPTDTDDHYLCHRPADSMAKFFSEEPDNVRALRGLESLSEEFLNTTMQFTSYQEAQNEFRELRFDIVESLGVEEEIDLDFYASSGEEDEPQVWIENQQRFFYEILGTTLHFFETPL